MKPNKECIRQRIKTYGWKARKAKSQSTMTRAQCARIASNKKDHPWNNDVIFKNGRKRADIL